MADTTAPDDVPQTAGQMFTTIAGHLDVDYIELAFEPELGYPVMARIDPMSAAVGEEIDSSYSSSPSA